MNIRKFIINILKIVICASIYVVVMIVGKDIHSKIFAHFPLWINIILCLGCIILINKAIDKRTERKRYQ